MNTLTRKRTIAKLNLTKAYNKLKDIISDFEKDTKINKTKIEFEIKTFEENFKHLNNIQEEIELIIDEDQLENESAQAEEFISEKREALIEASDILRKICEKPEPTENKTSHSNGATSTKLNARLPKLELPKFNGDHTKWQTFWDKFNAIVDESDISDINKFTYLQSLLRDEAQQSIAGLSLTAENYKFAREILENRFGQKERIISGHIQKLLQMATNKKAESQEQLWRLHDQIQINIRSLENLGISGSTYGVILVPIIMHLLPESIRYEYTRHCEGKERDLDYLLTFLQEEIRRREKAQIYLPAPSDQQRQKAYSHRSTTSMLQGVNQTRNVFCAFCSNEDHNSVSCPKVQTLSTPERKELIRKLRLCFRCLSKGHLVSECKKKYKCKECKRDHNTLLCPNKTNTTNQHEQGGQTQPPHQIRGEYNSQFLGVARETKNIDLASQYVNTGQCSTLLQVAHTEINNTKITVMLDTGSDRSYITRSTAQKLDLVSKQKDTVALATFGGKGVKCSSAEVYNLNMGEKVLTLLGIKTICKPLYRKCVPVEHLLPFRLYQPNENLNEGVMNQIDILIGIDHYYDVLNPAIVCMSGGLVCQNSMFGYIISGTYPGIREALTSATLLCQNCEPLEKTMKIWHGHLIL